MRVEIRVVDRFSTLGFTRFINRDYAIIDLYYRVLENPVYIDAILNHELMHVLACKIFNKKDCNSYGEIKGFNEILPIAKTLLLKLPEKQDPILYNLYSGLDVFVGSCEYRKICNQEEITLHVYSILYILLYRYNHKDVSADYQTVLRVLRQNGFPVPLRGLIYSPDLQITTGNINLMRYIDIIYKPYGQYNRYG